MWATDEDARDTASGSMDELEAAADLEAALEEEMAGLDGSRPVRSVTRSCIRDCLVIEYPVHSSLI